MISFVGAADDIALNLFTEIPPKRVTSLGVVQITEQKLSVTTGGAAASAIHHENYQLSTAIS